jgi:hypothetical protein
MAEEKPRDDSAQNEIGDSEEEVDLGNIRIDNFSPSHKYRPEEFFRRSDVLRRVLRNQLFSSVYQQ